jgi:predicted metalloendopeptidase
MRRPLPSFFFFGACALAGCALVGCAAASPTAPVPPVTTAMPSASVSAAAPPLSLAQSGIEPSWVDPTADPCQDYFAYACGGFVKSTVIPPDRATWGVTEAIQKSNEELLRDVLEKAAASSAADAATRKMGDYYAACVDEAAIEKAGVTPIQPLLATVAAVKDFESLAGAIGKLHAASVFALFDISSQQDFKDARRMIAALDQNGLGLPDRDYYLKDEGNLKEVRDFYRGHVGRMFSLAGTGPAETKAAVDDVLRIETKIARLQQDKVTRRDPYKTYHRVDRAGLTAAAKTFPWDAYFRVLRFPELQEISVNEPAYFTGIDALLHDETPASWRHYLAWQVVRSKARLLGRAIVGEAFAMRQKLSGQKELEPRWKRCVRGVDGALGELLAQPYVAAKFPGDSKARAQQLVDAIRGAMRDNLRQLRWMDDPTRNAALAKIDKMNAKVGYPDKWRAYDFVVTPTSYAANAMASEGFELRRALAKVGKPVDRAEWMMTPPTVNAYYDPSMNEIALPAGELQPPFFSRDFYAPVNIGDEGANTIGHEITHAFDDEGSKFDGDGNLRDWWSAQTTARFEQATQCVRDQYAQYEAVPGVKLNGALTSGENIADIGGVKLGYAALVAWKKAHPDEERTVEGTTDEQLFFLAYAQGWCSKETPQVLEMRARTDPHSPPRWRVNGPMADIPAFAEAYHCKAGTPMNTGHACSVW